MIAEGRAPERPSRRSKIIIDMDEPQARELRLDHVQTVEISKQLQSNQWRISPTKAIRVAGLETTGYVRYLPSETNDTDVVIAVAAPEADSDDDDVYSIIYSDVQAGSDQLTVPRYIQDALEVNTETSDQTDQTTSSILLDVYTNDGMLALSRPQSVTVPGDTLSTATDIKNDTHGEDLTLKTAQTTVPRAYDRTISTAGITRAFNHAGGDFEAIEFLPELADDLNGLVPAVARDDGLSGGTNTRTIRRQGPEPQGAAVSFPDDVLSALDVSVDDIYGVAHSKRPVFTIYAGDGALGFDRPRQRTIPISKSVAEYLRMDYRNK